MNEKIRAHVKAYNEAQGFKTDDNGIILTIRESPEVWTGNFSGRRHWDDCLTVVNVNGMLVGFDNAKTTGDESPSDKGWEFNADSICEVEEKTVTTKIYKRK